MKFKNDRFRKARGGYSRFLQITCRKCKSRVCFYQKDGEGSLRRMYVDRMIEPKVSLTKKELICPKGHSLGVKTMYEKEQRPAFRLFVDAVEKKIMSMNKASLW
jgi:hypothetical protein